MPSESPHLENVEYDSTLPTMNREQIDMLLMPDDGNEAHCLAKELFEIYSIEAREKLLKLEGACAERNAQEVRNIVHFIAGSASNLGLARFSAFCRATEKAIDEGKFTDFERAPEVIRGEFDAACESFRAAFGL